MEIRVECHAGDFALLGSDHGKNQQEQVDVAGLEEVHVAVAKDLVVDGESV